MNATNAMTSAQRPSRMRGVLIAILLLVLAPYAMWRIFLYCTFAKDTGRAMRGVREFQAYLDKGGPIPATKPDGSGEIWSEHGRTFFDLGEGAGLSFNYDVLCRSPQPPELGTDTERGIVISCEPIGDGFYWLVVNN